MSFTYCTSAAIIVKAGKNVSSDAVSAAIIQQFCDNAEGYVNVATRYDWTVVSAAIGINYPNFKPLLSEVISDLAAIDMINYDMSGYTGRGEAEDMINVLYDKATNGIEILKKMKRPEVEI